MAKDKKTDEEPKVPQKSPLVASNGVPKFDLMVPLYEVGPDGKLLGTGKWVKPL
jgi:hypothetical protein